MTFDDTIRKKVEYYLNNRIKVHLKKTNKLFYNGVFTSKLSDERYKFRDSKLGEIDVFLFEIYDITAYFDRSE